MTARKATDSGTVIPPSLTAMTAPQNNSISSTHSLSPWWDSLLLLYYKIFITYLKMGDDASFFLEYLYLCCHN